MAVVENKAAEAKTGTDLQPSCAGAPSNKIAPQIGKYRWTICGLLLAITTLNYMDRQILALLLPILQDPVKGIGLTQVQYGVIVSIFSCAYAVGLLLTGNVIDHIGAKKGYAAAVIVWSIAALSHFFVVVPAVTGRLSFVARLVSRILLHVPLVGNAGWVKDIGILSGAIIGFGVVRFLLGLGEAGNFPAAVKTTAEWLPKKERSFATGIFNAGTNIGPTIMPFLVGFVVMRFGWRYAFLITGLFTATWLAIWLKIYAPPRRNPRVSPEELAYINSDPAEPESKIVWSHLIPHRQTWAFSLRQAIDRSHLVVLSFLAARISIQPIRTQHHQDGSAAARHLQRLHDRQHLWRLVAHPVHQHGLEPKPCA